jgi:hypothetical protein
MGTALPALVGSSIHSTAGGSLGKSTHYTMRLARRSGTGIVSSLTDHSRRQLSVEELTWIKRRRE